MIVVRVELHSAITRTVKELARMHICNVGGTHTKGDYSVETFRGRDKKALDKMIVQRSGKVQGYSRLAKHVWCLVSQALAATKYDSTEKEIHS